MLCLRGHFKQTLHLRDLLSGARFPALALHFRRVTTLLDTEDAPVEMVQWYKDGLFVAHDVVLEPPGEPGAYVVFDGRAGGNSEYIVELLECSLFSFGNEEEDHHEGDNVECARWRSVWGDGKGRRELTRRIQRRLVE
jgi:hypothetical protein